MCDDIIMIISIDDTQFKLTSPGNLQYSYSIIHVHSISINISVSI